MFTLPKVLATPEAYELRLSAGNGLEGRYAGGQVFAIGADGRGFREAWKFLASLGEHYSDAVRAAGKLVQRMSVTSFDDVAEAVSLVLRPVARKAVQAVHPDVRRALCEVATVAAGCIFGIDDAIPDCDKAGAFNPEYVPCPMRDICEFNGWGEDPAITSICNPVYDTGLRGHLQQWLIKLTDSDDDIGTLSAAAGVSRRTADTYASQVYQAMGVRSRGELKAKLAGKRIK